MGLNIRRELEFPASRLNARKVLNPGFHLMPHVAHEVPSEQA